MTSIKDRLLAVEDQFIDALSIGGDALNAFDKEWEILLEDISAALDCGAMDDETSSLAHIIASRIAVLADASVDIVASYNTITSELLEEIDTLMAQLTLSDSFPHHREASPTSPPQYTSLALKSFPVELKADTHRTPPSRKRVRSSDEMFVPSSTRTKKQRLLSPVIPAHTDASCNDVLPCKPPPVSPSREIAPAPSRKRRLSESDTASLPDPKRRLAGPRLHAVSDSFVSCYPPKYAQICSTAPGLISAISDTPSIPLVANDSGVDYPAKSMRAETSASDTLPDAPAPSDPSPLPALDTPCNDISTLGPHPPPIDAWWSSTDDFDELFGFASFDPTSTGLDNLVGWDGSDVVETSPVFTASGSDGSSVSSLSPVSTPPYPRTPMSGSPLSRQLPSTESQDPFMASLAGHTDESQSQSNSGLLFESSTKELIQWPPVMLAEDCGISDYEMDWKMLLESFAPLVRQPLSSGPCGISPCAPLETSLVLSGSPYAAAPSSCLFRGSTMA